MQERESIIFITKDAFCKDYLPCYGNQYWSGHTPNIDKLVENGSVLESIIQELPRQLCLICVCLLDYMHMKVN